MAKNYKIDTNKEIIYVDLETLTEKETEEVKKLKTLGYKILPKRKNTTKTPKEKHIVKWLNDNGKKEELKKFNAVKEEKITDKNGKKRKGGYLIAIKWFRETFPAEYKEIKDSL